MTGMDCLKEELIKRGYKAHHIENIKVLPLILDILCQSGNRYSDIARIEEDIRELQKKKDQLTKEVAFLRQNEDWIKNRIKEYAEKNYVEAIKYIERFFDVLGNCETPEGRDALKRAQMYVNSVSVDTKYDNTAFIVGLAGILTNGGIAPVEELHKINPKIPKFPDIDVETRWNGDVCFNGEVSKFNL